MPDETEEKPKEEPKSVMGKHKEAKERFLMNLNAGAGVINYLAWQLNWTLLTFNPFVP